MSRGIKSFQVLLLTLIFLCPSLLHAQTSREKQLIESIKREKNDTKKFLRMLSLGEFYKHNNIYRADSMSHVLLQKSRVFNDSLRFTALMYSAEINEIEGNQEEYFKDVLGCQSFLNKLNSDEAKFKIYRHLGYYHSYSLEFDAADFYLKYIKKTSIKKRNNSKVAEADNYLALNFMFQNKKDSALYYADEAIQYARRSSDKSILSECFNNQARIYDYFGQLELSVAKNIVALNLATEANDIFLLAKYNRELGISQRSILNLEDAEYYFKKSYEYSQQIVDRRQMGLALSNLGTIYYKRKEFKKAIDNTRKAIVILTALNDFNGLGEAHDNLGMIYREQKDYTQAASNFNQALVFYESTSNKEKIAGVYHNVGTVFQKQKKYKNALNYLERSIEIRQQFGSKNQIYNTYRVMSGVYKDIGKTKESLTYLQLYLDYLDSNTTLQAATKIAELSELYRSEQRERLIVLQADSLERQKQERTITSTKFENSQLRNNFQTYIIFGFLIIIILAGIIGFYRWNQTKIKQQQKEAEMSQTLLRAQMNPHFVFNAMSVIQSYIYENDTINSTKFLVNFSRLMRLILENSPKEYIPIETEVEILQKYLETQKLRFEDRFEFKIEVSSEIIMEHTVIPPMITQPFIENAIEHGQLHTIEGGFIYISFQKVNNLLQILIEDNGVGRTGAKANKKSKDHKSMAMNITKERIDNLNKKYKTAGFLLIEDFNKELHTGTKVLISLPYKEEKTKPIDS